jgi:hypothetical protein
MKSSSVRIQRGGDLTRGHVPQIIYFFDRPYNIDLQKFVYTFIKIIIYFASKQFKNYRFVQRSKGPVICKNFKSVFISETLILHKIPYCNFVLIP